MNSDALRPMRSRSFGCVTHSTTGTHYWDEVYSNLDKIGELKTFKARGRRLGRKASFQSQNNILQRIEAVARWDPADSNKNCRHMSKGLQKFDVMRPSQAAPRAFWL